MLLTLSFSQISVFTTPVHFLLGNFFNKPSSLLHIFLYICQGLDKAVVLQ